MFLGLTTIEYKTANIIADFGDDCYGVYHHTTGYVGIYAKDGDDLLQISDKLIKNPNQTPETIAQDMWGN
tara:strand:+ start:89 stop:298 length:210 start_codon:yes stop_codon:yes gene_type:complete